MVCPNPREASDTQLTLRPGGLPSTSARPSVLDARPSPPAAPDDAPLLPAFESFPALPLLPRADPRGQPGHEGPRGPAPADAPRVGPRGLRLRHVLVIVEHLRIELLDSKLALARLATVERFAAVCCECEKSTWAAARLATKECKRQDAIRQEAATLLALGVATVENTFGLQPDWQLEVAMANMKLDRKAAPHMGCKR